MFGSPPPSLLPSHMKITLDLSSFLFFFMRGVLELQKGSTKIRPGGGVLTIYQLNAVSLWGSVPLHVLSASLTDGISTASTNTPGRRRS